MESDAQPQPVQSALPFAERVRVVTTDQPFRWLAAGWRDFRAAMAASIAYGMIVVVAGFALSFLLAGAGLLYLVLPLIVGFLLVGPALTVGYYGMSQDLEAGRRPSFGTAIMAWRANPGPLLAFGLVLVCFLVLWMRFAALVFAICFPNTMLSVQALLNAALFTEDGLIFLAVGTVVGGVMASIAFAAGAFSLPLLLDRKVGVMEALVTSVTAVVLNAPAMVVWAALVVLFAMAGLALGYVGLAVTLPLLGHATWHAYRAVIRF
ncbi:DUF2189 domain-containing protein [Rhodopila sp.]|jgi:uncharacterized membrane protein|uniref:DUF2189 domain-containing protein n=1 Tax=Rhodopila sp. TaxID=2480087 RepID=UPI002C9331AE|nr:DUF2189 domain-containing protein [Rhodopila sp.]HVZ08098.1 DUF2189 domain-containing protein [Rhodopila sp.]